ncbi:hypothetical protein BGW80DRAFT_1327586 [Lactifluus volemus]|nr:hypothetical protein BGW80DRAFT_1327586 [Lactifluus volemus]
MASTGRAGAGSNVPTKQTFVVWAPENTDLDAYSRRHDVRAERKKRLDRLGREYHKLSENQIKRFCNILSPASVQHSETSH